MTDQALELNTAAASTNTDDSIGSFADIRDRLAKLGKPIARRFWQVTEEHGKADTSSFEGLL